MEQLPTGGEQKVQEYINRIKNGESKDKILEGLPTSFIDDIEKGLERNSLKDNYASIENLQQAEKDKYKRQEREDSDNKKIEEIRKELGINDIDDKKDNNIEKYNISLPNINEIIKNGGGQLEVFANGKNIEFSEFVITIDGNFAEVMFIRKKDPTQNKGVGVPIYIELGKRLAENGITLCSSKAQYGPGHDLWLKLSQIGFTEKINGGFSFKNEKISNKELREGSPVKYQGRKWKIKEIINQKYEINGKIEIRPIYNLERDDGYILQDGGVKKFIFQNDFEIDQDLRG